MMLKSCPFCGEASSINLAVDAEHGCYVKCEYCGAHTSCTKTPTRPAHDWNTRSLSVALDEVIMHIHDLLRPNNPLPVNMKRCPFCGCYMEVMDTHSDGSEHYVECTVCGARVTSCFSREDAITAWNSRSVDAALDELLTHVSSIFGGGRP